MSNPHALNDEFAAQLMRLARGKVWQGLTLAECEQLPHELGMHPRRVKVFDDVPGYVTVFVHRKWWQRLIPGHKRKWTAILEREYQARKAAGIIVEVYVR